MPPLNAAEPKAITLNKLASLEVHPFAEIFPMASDAEIEGMAQSMLMRGFKKDSAIIIYDGMILDGRNRRVAAMLVGKLDECPKDFCGLIVEFESELAPLDWVLSENLDRRHLNTSQKALVAANLAQWEVGMNQHAKVDNGGSANLRTQKQLAQSLSISERAIASARRISQSEKPQLIEAVKQGALTVHTAEALIELGDKELSKALDNERREIIKLAKKLREERMRVSRNIKLTKVAAIAQKGKTKVGTMPRNMPVGYMDVPWKNYVHDDATGHDKSPEMHYPTMTNEEIEVLCAGSNTPFGPDAALFFWTTANRIDIATDIVRGYGFDFKSSMVWDKEIAGTGRWVRDQFEILFIATRGNIPCPLPGDNYPSVYREKKGKHSVKPQFFAQMIDEFYPTLPKVEFFNRCDLLPEGDIRLHEREQGQWQFWGFEA